MGVSYKMFGGKRYTFVEGVESKREANKSANQMRRVGNSVHVVKAPTKSKSMYWLYARRKQH